MTRGVTHLDSFSGSGHVHGVGQVGPGDARVGSLDFQHLWREEGRRERGVKR